MRVHGARVGFQVSEASVLDMLAERLPYGAQVAQSPLVDSLYSFVLGGRPGKRGPKRFHTLYSGWETVVRTLDQEVALDEVMARLDFAVATQATERVFVHAGVVGWRGQAILLPGRSLSGKTTLAMALVRAGAEYMSDEFAVVDRDGLVHPHPRPPRVREPGSSKPGRRSTLDQLGGAIADGSLPIGMVAHTAFAEGETWQPEELSPGPGLLRVLDNTVVAKTNPQLAMSVLAPALRPSRHLAGVRGEADAAARMILSTLEGAAPP